MITEKTYPILFPQPVLKSMVWGGNRLVSEFGYTGISDTVGECWGISAHPSGDSRLLNMEYNGMTLSELWSRERDFFGDFSDDTFPLLTKIIDAEENLSIQVHPDDAYASRVENGSLGKTECWYVAACPKNATLIIGHRAQTRDELEKMVHEGRWDELLRRVPVAPGDFIQIEPGTIHAITAGCLVVETQQNSDITYRLYDYDRKINGRPRELHIRKSLDVIQVPSKSAEEMVLHTAGMKKNQWNLLISCSYYRVYKLELSGKISFSHNETFLNVTVVEGEGQVNGIPVRKGQHFILPARFGTVTVDGEMVLLASDAGVEHAYKAISLGDGLSD